MKKGLANLTKLGAGIAIAAVIASCNNKEQPKTTTAPANTTEKKEAEAIVYVNSDSLLTNYEYFKDIKGKIEGKSKQAQTDLQSKGTAFQQEVAEYQKNAQGMSADQRAATEQRLARKQQELSAYNQNASSALANEQAAENDKLYDKVASYLKGYAKEKGYKMVLTYSKANPTVLFADESLDVTKDVLAGLNAEYKKDKK
ncbi:OmpH family outer membrane protein [Pedobacter sp. HMF7647]|uniref:OmpH family outer membrane protein n=1 Tax=Hufsiella arboris TaxID=2695275 RepID=A0A7K1YET0_9SPHI|nr:OmpH family outer membrane protein [Hufsiella arboris]MXV53117.1 OmpH family outer membrane protein [Hufsiella arboris]